MADDQIDSQDVQEELENQQVELYRKQHLQIMSEEPSDDR